MSQLDCKKQLILNRLQNGLINPVWPIIYSLKKKIIKKKKKIDNISLSSFQYK